jgi:uncharacterized membrane protein YkoI
MRRPITWMMALLLVVADPAAGTQADDRKHDQDMVRQAVERGEIKALADILAAIRDRLPGEVAGVEIERKAGRWLYEFRVVGGKGRLFEVYVDAHTGEIERIKEK